ncbi:MAG: ribosomal RNA small subunit methyltransferase A [Bdellovibrionaceae bacterium]|nr:ribosomal RNA small subunit methyltransferase A [Pseudobdellovibrionaceae bacterium]
MSSLYAAEIQRIKLLLEQFGRGSKRSLGQNFLVNSGKIEQIVSYVKEMARGDVIEIGPGLGALTLRLIGEFPKIKLIELDTQFAEYWRSQNADVINEDALHVNWQELHLNNAVLVSNLPYQISSRIVVDRSIQPYGLEYMVLMFQKEVAQRLIARPSTEDYGLLSVIAQTYWQLETMTELGPNDFFPPPKVASRVVTFKRKSQDMIQDGESYLRFVKQSFSHRRKLLRNNIANLCGGETLNHAMVGMGLNEKVRPEELSWSQYCELFKRTQDS